MLLGKLTTSGSPSLPIVDTEIHPPTRNPRSGESATPGGPRRLGAAIASGMLPIVVASDGAGSIRIPARVLWPHWPQTTRDLLLNPFFGSSIR